MKIFPDIKGVFTLKDLAGLIVSALICSVLCLLPYIIPVMLKTPNVGNPSNVIILAFASLLFGPILFVLMLLLSAPIVLRLKKRNLNSYKSYSKAGLVAGAIIGSLVSTAFFTFPIFVYAKIICALTVMGATTGLVYASCFWFIAIKNWPNQRINQTK